MSSINIRGQSILAGVTLGYTHSKRQNIEALLITITKNLTCVQKHEQSLWSKSQNCCQTDINLLMTV